MKFKTLYILFNAVIVAAFLFIFLLPLAMLGPDYFRQFAQKNWIAALLFLATLIIINGYFAYNWKLFSLLEKEDWPGLIRHLEDSIFRRGRLAKGSCRLLLNAYLITGNSEAVAALETRVRRDKPGLIKTLALPFGLPYLLRKQPEREAAEAAAGYFGPLAGEPGVGDRGWVRWNYAFSLMRLGRYEEARAQLDALLEGRPKPELRLLGLYMLESFVEKDPRLGERLERGKLELRRQLSREQWRRRLEAGGNPQVTLLAPVIKEAADWLFSDRASAGNS